MLKVVLSFYRTDLTLVPAQLREAMPTGTSMSLQTKTGLSKGHPYCETIYVLPGVQKRLSGKDGTHSVALTQSHKTMVQATTGR